ncbi:ATP-binding protein [Streptomyces sp. NPDC047085]|uniref:ATP-binding protein n=1 Tax=Streptomyces sp. NPDC047085 TaxID=3155140 RepID=UPI0034118269
MELTFPQCRAGRRERQSGQPKRSQPERRAIAIASNAPFSEWKQTITDARLCTAIVDRVTCNAHIVETGTQSHRFAQSQRKRRRRPAPTTAAGLPFGTPAAAAAGPAAKAQYGPHHRPFPRSAGA